MSLTILLLFICATSLFVYRIKRHRRRVLRRNRENWSIGIYDGPTPFTLHPKEGVINPIMTAEDVTDVKARFVADPFMIEHDNEFHLFFEVLNSSRNKGEIGHARSSDMKRWTYNSIVLREWYHLSYPYVFSHDGSLFMIPECLKSKEIRLYKADPFPVRWRHAATLVKGKNRFAPLSDPSIIQHNGRWYLFVNARKLNNLHLFSSDTLFGPWKEHPKSPIITASLNYSRPGGRIVSHEGSLYRFCQDGVPHYGSKVWAFRITELSALSFSEEIISGGPVVEAGSEGWNCMGMHTVDPHRQKNGHWIAIVDGLEHRNPA